jgi:hypothetical protein
MRYLHPRGAAGCHPCRQTPRDRRPGSSPSVPTFPCWMEAEQALAARGLLLLPDFIANAGGVICAAIEYRGGTEGRLSR